MSHVSLFVLDCVVNGSHLFAWPVEKGDRKAAQRFINEDWGGGIEIVDEIHYSSPLPDPDDRMLKILEETYFSGSKASDTSWRLTLRGLLDEE